MPKKYANWGMTHNTNLLFSDKELLNEQFLLTDLGQLYLSVPFEELSTTVPPPEYSKSGLGRRPWFDVNGGIALQFLKHKLGLSDSMLIKRINTDWSMQLFCGISLRPGERIKDENLPGWWRCYLGKYIDIEKMQKSLATHWKPYMENTQVGAQDATCYESSITYPTDVKILWDCCQKGYQLINKQRKKLKLRKSRLNFAKRQKLFLDYQKSRKKSRKAQKKLRKKLLKFVLRLLSLYEELGVKHHIELSRREKKLLRTIKKIYQQQHLKAYGEKGVKIPDRIVSLSKPYVRPILRGKETKSIEFGAKVNKLQVDGISFIEHISFDNFNETTRFDNGIYLQRKLFGKCTHQSADAIYATNKNRKYATSQGILGKLYP